MSAKKKLREGELIDAILPAGGRISGSFAHSAGTDIKALILFNGVSILERTILALSSLNFIGRIVIVGPEATHAVGLAAGVHAALDELETGSANILRGVEWLRAQQGGADRVLVATTDMPFLTAESVSAFIAMCPLDRDICVPVVERTLFERIYPGLVRTDTKLADGWFRVGGLYLLNPETLLRNRARFEQYFAVRKSNIQIAKLVGLRTVLGYVTHRLSSEDIVQRVGEILQCTGAVIKDAPPEIGFDVDLLEEYVYALNRFTSGDNAGKETKI